MVFLVNPIKSADLARDMHTDGTLLLTQFVLTLAGVCRSVTGSHQKRGQASEGVDLNVHSLAGQHSNRHMDDTGYVSYS